MFLAIWRRFIFNGLKTQVRRAGWISQQERRDALKALIRRCQLAHYLNETDTLTSGESVRKSSSLFGLSPVLDKAGILRVGGRIGSSKLGDDQRHPIILPSQHRLTYLVITEVHEEFLLCSVERTLRQHYWVLKARRKIKSVTHRCPTCIRDKASLQVPFMADLPASCLEVSHPPFTNVGTDFFDPYLITMKRSAVKRWCCVFTCFVTKAVHIEITHSMDASSFIMALRRFISRRGTPAVIYSDNGTNFVGGEREMREAVENWNQNKVADAMSNKGIEWSPTLRRRMGENGPSL